MRTWERLKAATFKAAREELARPDAHPERWLDEHRARAVFGDGVGASDLVHWLEAHPDATSRLHAELALTQYWQGHFISSEALAQAATERSSPNENPLCGLRLHQALDVGDLDDALEQLAAHRSLGDLRQGSLHRLLRLLVERNRPREISRLLARVLAVFPHLAYAAEVRRAARYANKALDGARPIVLPPLPGEHRTRNLAVAAAGLLVAVFLAAEIYARLHRPVWLVATRAERLEVAIDGVSIEPIRKRGARRVDLAYGAHSIVISGARQRGFDVALEPRGALALLDDRAHVIDLSGDAILSVSHAPGSRAGGSAAAQALYGRNVYEFDEVACAFGQALREPLLSRRTDSCVVELDSRGDLTLALEHVAAGRSAAGLALLEDRIARDPKRDDLDLAYAWTAADCGKQAQALVVLAPKLALTPLAVRAHDAARYVLTEDEAARLRADYEARFASTSLTGAEGAYERSMAALLRAHLCAERAEALRWLALAREADPRNVRALQHSVDLLAGLDWRSTLAFALAGLALDPHDVFLLGLRSGARMALGEADELERELRAELEVHPRHQERQGRLAELLVVTQRSTELDLFISDAERRRGGANHARRLRALALEAGGRLEELAASDFDPRDEERTRWQVLALAELGRGREFDARLGRERRVVDRWYDALAIDLCFRLVEDEPRERRWRAHAMKRLARHSAHARAIELLSAPTPASAPEIEALALGSHETSMLLLAEAQRAHGEQRAALLESVARFHPWPGHVQRLSRRLETAP